MILSRHASRRRLRTPLVLGEPGDEGRGHEMENIWQIQRNFDRETGGKRAFDDGHFDTRWASMATISVVFIHEQKDGMLTAATMLGMCPCMLNFVYFMGSSVRSVKTDYEQSEAPVEARSPWIILVSHISVVTQLPSGPFPSFPCIKS